MSRKILDLRPGEVHLWSGAFVGRKKRGIILRNIAENYTDKILEERNLSFLPGGKPIFRNEPFHFNISHTANKIFIVFARFEVGVDVEMSDRKVSVAGISRKYFDPEECAFLESSSETEIRKIFFRLWVRKEAAVKMTGEGLACGLKKIKVDPKKEGWSVYRKGEPLFVKEVNSYPGVLGAIVARCQFSVTSYPEF